MRDSSIDCQSTQSHPLARTSLGGLSATTWIRVPQPKPDSTLPRDHADPLYTPIRPFLPAISTCLGMYWLRLTR
jgi:hypothetical protein